MVFMGSCNSVASDRGSVWASAPQDLSVLPLAPGRSPTASSAGTARRSPTTTSACCPACWCCTSSAPGRSLRRRRPSWATRSGATRAPCRSRWMRSPTAPPTCCSRCGPGPRRAGAAVPRLGFVHRRRWHFWLSSFCDSHHPFLLGSPAQGWGQPLGDPTQSLNLAVESASRCSPELKCHPSCWVYVHPITDQHPLTWCTAQCSPHPLPPSGLGHALAFSASPIPLLGLTSPRPIPAPRRPPDQRPVAHRGLRRRFVQQLRPAGDGAARRGGGHLWAMPSLCRPPPPPPPHGRTHTGFGSLPTLQSHFRLI